MATIYRRSLLSLFLALSCAATLDVRAADAPAKPKLNVLFFAVDDLRTEFGAYGKTYIHSPNLDRIAARGVTFNRAYCQQAVCSPSRSSLLTGTRPDTTKVWDLETHFRKAIPDVVTLPQHFKEQGYFTQGMGKLYHGGFDDPPSWSTPWTTGKGQGTYALPENRAIVESRQQQNQNPNQRRRANRTGPKGPAYEMADVSDDHYGDGNTAQLAVTALQECAERKQPFWLGVGFARPHLPFVAPKKYWDLYDPATIELAPNPFPPKYAPEYAIGPGGELRSYAGIPAGPIPDDLARTLKHGYYAAISYMDAQVGKVLDELERLGLADNTVIVLWGDHGWKLGEHAGWCKHSNCENDANAPLLISVPGLAAGRRTDALAEFVDIYPTLADACGLPLPAHLEGTSLLPVLRDPAASVKRAAFSQYPRAVDGQQLMGYSMRTDRYRFTRWVHRNDHSQLAAVELYDHQADPQENTNIAADPAHAALVAELTQQWEAGWRGAKRE